MAEMQTAGKASGTVFLKFKQQKRHDPEGTMSVLRITLTYHTNILSYNIVRIKGHKRPSKGHLSIAEDLLNDLI